MLQSVTKPNGDTRFLQEIYSIPGGELIRRCIQCGTCSGSCPNADKMDYSPRQLIAMARAGMRDDVLRSNSMWFCVSCYLCTVRCPRDIRLTDVMYAFKHLAVRDNLTRKRGRTSTLAKTFVSMVNRYGRNNEAGLLIRYFLTVNPLDLLRMAPLGLRLLLRGRMPLRGKRIRGIRDLQAIIKKAEGLEVAE